MVNFKDNYHYPSFQGSGGGPTFSRRVQLFPGGGVQLLIPIETHITCDFPGGWVWTPSPPLDPHLSLWLWHFPVILTCFYVFSENQTYLKNLAM